MPTRVSPPASNQDYGANVAPPPTGGGSGAPTNATYVVMSLDGTLSAERVLTAGTGISITDGGANGNVTISASGSGGFDWGKYIAGQMNWPLG